MSRVSPVGGILGIPVGIDWSLVVILPVLAWLFGGQMRRAAEVAGMPIERIAGPPWAWGLFLAVLVHELAHALYARHASPERSMPRGGLHVVVSTPDAAPAALRACNNDGPRVAQEERRDHGAAVKSPSSNRPPGIATPVAP